MPTRTFPDNSQLAVYMGQVRKEAVQALLFSSTQDTVEYVNGSYEDAHHSSWFSREAVQDESKDRILSLVVLTIIF